MNFVVKSIRRLPYLFLVIFFASGIATEYKIQLGDINMIGVAVSVVVALVLFGIYLTFGKSSFVETHGRINTFEIFPVLSTLVLLLAFFFFGGMSEHRIHPLSANELESIQDSSQIYVARISSVPKVSKSRRVTCDADVFMPTSTLVSAILTFDTCDVSFKKDDFIVFSSSLKSTENGEFVGFNYDTYLRKKGIDATAMVRRFEIIGNPQGIANTFFSLETSASELNDDLKNAIAKVDVNGVDVSEEDRDARNLIVAITLGNKTEMDDDLKEAYSKAGASHLLAVSGLHVGVIILIVEFLVGMLIAPKRYPFTFALTLLSIIWGYAFLTGLAASVVRTSLMYTVYRVALLLFRKANPINVVSFTAFVMLVYDPFWIFDLGFQLSFGAVYSILLFGQPMIRKIEEWVPEIKSSFKKEGKRRPFKRLYGMFVIGVSKLRTYIIGSVSISIAAQVLTTPIVLLTFHRLPILSIISSLVTIPLVSILIPLSFVYYGFYGLSTLLPIFTPVSDFVLYLATLLAKAVNAIVYYTADFSFCTVDRLPFYFYDVVVWISVFLLIVAYYNYRRLLLLRISVVISFFYFVIALLDGVKEKESRMLAVYNVNGVTAVNRMTETNTLFGCTDYAKVDKKADEFWTNQLRPSPSSEERNFFEFEKQRVYILSDKDEVKQTLKSPLDVDVLILTDNVATKRKDLRNFRYGKLIVDGSNKYYVAKKWNEERQKSGADCHIVRFDGSYISKKD